MDTALLPLKKKSTKVGQGTIRRMFQFFIGVGTGIYLAQTYELPNLAELSFYVRDQLSEHVKKRKKND